MSYAGFQLIFELISTKISAYCSAKSIEQKKSKVQSASLPWRTAHCQRNGTNMLCRKKLNKENSSMEEQLRLSTSNYYH